MDLPILTAPTTNKPWLNIYSNSVTSKTIIAETSITAPSIISTGDVEIKDDLLVNGYSSSSEFGAGFMTLSANTQTIAAPAGRGGGQITFNPSLDKITVSGLAGVNTCFDTTNGSTFNTLATPIASLAIEYSPELNIYTAIDVAGTAVYTSPTAVGGSFVLQAPAPSTFAAAQVNWISQVGRFYTCSADAANRVFSSVDGITWTKFASNRDFFNVVYSPLLSRLVAVGAGGPQYSDDGKTWINSATASPMSSVCWSDYWKCFVATPRVASPLTSVFRSVDGINWTSTTGFPTAAGNLRTIIWIQDFMLFVAAGDNDVLWISQNGLLFRQVRVVPVALSVYDQIYVAKWGFYFSTGVGSFARVGLNRLLS